VIETRRIQLGCPLRQFFTNAVVALLKDHAQPSLTPRQRKDLGQPGVFLVCPCAIFDGRERTEKTADAENERKVDQRRARMAVTS
jgi:hypothetical protein